MHYRVIQKYIGRFYYKEEMEFGDNLVFLHGTEPNIGRMFVS